MQFNALRLEFEKSRSNCFKEALALAKRFPSFEEKNINDITAYSVYFSPEYFDNFIALIRLIQGWKSTRILVGDRILRKVDFYRISTIYDCYRRKQEFISQQYYCFVSDGYYSTDQVFPCKQIRLTWRDLVRDERYGQTFPDGSVHLNKERILFEVEHRLRLTLAIYCPCINSEAVQANFTQFPSMISQNEKDTILGNNSFSVTVNVPIDKKSLPSHITKGNYHVG